MIEEGIIEWLDLGDSVQKIDIYEKQRLLVFFKFHYLLLKHGIMTEVVDIFSYIIFFLQIISLAAVNIEEKEDTTIKVIKYFENILLPHTLITTSERYILISIIVLSINVVHIVLISITFILLFNKIVFKSLFIIISTLNFLLYYYLIGSLIYITLYGTLCTNNIHDILKVECYSSNKHLALLVLNFISIVYCIFVVEFFAIYHNQIGTISGSDSQTRVNCYYDIYSCNAKLLVYIIVYFYLKYSKDMEIFKYVYQVYIFLSCFIMAVYSINRVYYYNKRIDNLIHYFWLIDTWFAACMLLKVCFDINDITLLTFFGWALILISYQYQKYYSHLNIISQLDIFNEQNFIYLEKFNRYLMELYLSEKKKDKILLNGIIKKYENFIFLNPELKQVYSKILNDTYLKKRFYKLNHLQTLSLVYTIYYYYLDKSTMKNEVILYNCYFLVNHLKNLTYALFLLTKLKTTYHKELYYKFILMEEIKEYLIKRLKNRISHQTLNHIEIGSVILYYQYMDLFKIKIYDATCRQIDYFDFLRNNVTSGKLTENFLKTGEEILNLKKEIVKLWEKIIGINQFCNETENDYMIYLKTILQDDMMAKSEEKKFNLIKSTNLPEKNNVYYSLFKNEFNSVVLIDGYSTNGKILYATPNFPNLFKFSGKDIFMQIEELIPNVIQPFHKDLIDNMLKFSDISNVFQSPKDSFIKGKNNCLYNVNLYIKPVPNMIYGLLYFTLITKIQEHEFIIILDKDFKIDSFTEMNQGSSFTLNANAQNIYSLSSNAINRHICLIIPEILLQLYYKDNAFYINKDDIVKKGNLYSTSNFKDTERKLNFLLELIKKRGYLLLDEDTDDGKVILNHYNDYKKHIIHSNVKAHSIFFKIVTRKFLNGKHKYYRIYISNDPLSLNENNLLDQETGSRNLVKNTLIKQVDIEKSADNEGTKPNRGPLRTIKSIKSIKKRHERNKRIHKSKFLSEENMQKDFVMNNMKNDEANKRASRTNTLTSQKTHLDSAGFNKLKNYIVNKKDSIQIILMKLTSVIFVIVTVALAIYDYMSSMDSNYNLSQYLKENMFFRHSKIISACIYITSTNIKWFKYIDDDSCPINCSMFYLKILAKCINNLKDGKNSLYSFYDDFKEKILTKRIVELAVYNTEELEKLNLNVNDNLNYIISKGIKLVGAFENYINFFGLDKINMENLIYQSYDYFKNGSNGLDGEEKESKAKNKFKHNYIIIILGTILCVILLAIFSYFIFHFNKLETIILEKLIHFNPPNFDIYLSNLDDLKKKIKNYKNEEKEENNIDDINNDDSKNHKDSKENGSKGKESKENEEDKNDGKNKKLNEGERRERKRIKKKANKQNKIQQQRAMKKEIMSFYFFKENLYFAIKTSLILIIFVSFFIVSLQIYKLYLDIFLRFDKSSTEVEIIYYNSFEAFLLYKNQLEHYQSNPNYTMVLPNAKNVSINFGNILNELIKNGDYSETNKDELTQLYKGNLCLLLMMNETTSDYKLCREFLSSILLKGMEQALIQIGVMMNSVNDELSLIKDEKDFNNTIKGNSTNFKKYEMFIEYYFLLSYLKNEKIFDNFRKDETLNYSRVARIIIVVYFIIYSLLFVLLCYFIFMYKYTYNSLFNFIAILSIKFISQDDELNKIIIQLENNLYR